MSNTLRNQTLREGSFKVKTVRSHLKRLIIHLYCHRLISGRTTAHLFDLVNLKHA